MMKKIYKVFFFISFLSLVVLNAFAQDNLSFEESGWNMTVNYREGKSSSLYVHLSHEKLSVEEIAHGVKDITAVFEHKKYKDEKEKWTLYPVEGNPGVYYIQLIQLPYKGPWTMRMRFTFEGELYHVQKHFMKYVNGWKERGWIGRLKIY